MVFLSIEKPVDYDAVVQRFADQKPQRMFLVDPISIIFCILRVNTDLYL